MITIDDQFDFAGNHHLRHQGMAPLHHDVLSRKFSGEPESLLLSHGVDERGKPFMGFPVQGHLSVPLRLQEICIRAWSFCGWHGSIVVSNHHGVRKRRRPVAVGIRKPLADILPKGSLMAGD